MNAKIIIATHKMYDMPQDDIYLPVHVGREGKDALPYQPDNTGDNISAKNPGTLLDFPSRLIGTNLPCRVRTHPHKPEPVKFLLWTPPIPS